VLHEALGEEPANLLELLPGFERSESLEAVGRTADPGEPRHELAVLVAEPIADLGAEPGPGAGRPAARERAKGVQDHDDVDDLLQDRALDGREEPECPEEHPRERESHTDEHALERDPPRATGDL